MSSDTSVMEEIPQLHRLDSSERNHDPAEITAESTAANLPSIREIRTIETLQEVWNDSVFVAFNCEFLPFSETTQPTAFNVGLACLRPMDMIKAFSSIPTLKGFVTDRKVSAASVNITPRYQRRMQQIDDKPSKRKWHRQQFAFGDTSTSTTQQLPGKLREIVRQDFDLGSSKNLILTGYHMVHDWEALRRDVPDFTDMFAYYVDLRTIFQSIYPGTPLNELGLRKTLRLFGYGPKDYRTKVCYHDAGNDAVKILALLQGLRDVKNVSGLVEKQSAVEERMKKGHFMLVKENYRAPLNTPHLAVFEPADDHTASLPASLRPARRLASLLETYEPRRVGIYKKSERAYGKPLPRRYLGWAAFRSQEGYQNCVAALDGMVVDGIVIRVGERRLGAPFARESREAEDEMGRDGDGVDGIGEQYLHEE
ncbi:hypothetical protein GGR56DRAFT_222828 [Xylariaceae sp. FL0804]|nr:hypothetical protein GGR56DRAFT_222828 [Xylariaceae sp. FL0804]